MANDSQSVLTCIHSIGMRLFNRLSCLMFLSAWRAKVMGQGYDLLNSCSKTPDVKPLVDKEKVPLHWWRSGSFSVRRPIRSFRSVPSLRLLTSCLPRALERGFFQVLRAALGANPKHVLDAKAKPKGGLLATLCIH